MKLVLFTPATTASAIGRMASLVSRALIAQGHAVTVARTEDASLLDTDTHDFGVSAVPWNDARGLRRHVEGADALIYQIGDNLEFHRGCMEWLPGHPGIVCLHDFFLGHLFYGWSGTRREQALAVLDSWYGKDVADRFFAYPDSASFIDGTRDASPMTEWVCAMARAVVTHSRWGLDRVLRSCPGPVLVAPLAYDAVPDESGGAAPSADDGKLHLLTIGHVNPNKRVASMIRAIGDSASLRDRVRYRLVGKIEAETARSLTALAAERGVDLVISGEVGQHELTRAFARADVVSCLRWPSLEAASASAIESLLHGKPTLVTDTGFYRELPDDCVVKIDPVDELRGIRMALERLAEDPVFRHSLSGMGREWARRVFTAENYAGVLIRTIRSIGKAEPMLSAVGHFASLLTGWGVSARLLALEETAGPLRVFNEPTADTLA